MKLYTILLNPENLLVDTRWHQSTPKRSKPDKIRQWRFELYHVLYSRWWPTENGEEPVWQLQFLWRSGIWTSHMLSNWKNYIVYLENTPCLSCFYCVWAQLRNKQSHIPESEPWKSNLDFLSENMQHLFLLLSRVESANRNIWRLAATVNTTCLWELPSFSEIKNTLDHVQQDKQSYLQTHYGCKQCSSSTSHLSSAAGKIISPVCKRYLQHFYPLLTTIRNGKTFHCQQF